MPEFIEIKDEIFSVANLIKVTPDSIAVSTNEFIKETFFIRVLHTKGEDLVYFNSEDECKEAYSKVRQTLLKSTQKLNS